MAYYYLALNDEASVGLTLNKITVSWQIWIGSWIGARIGSPKKKKTKEKKTKEKEKNKLRYKKNPVVYKIKINKKEKSDKLKYVK